MYRGAEAEEGEGEGIEELTDWDFRPGSAESATVVVWLVVNMLGMVEVVYKG